MNKIQTIKTFILDTLFPISCLSCGKANDWLCEACLEKIPLKSEQICPLCEKNITPNGRVCFSCRKKSSLDGLLAASSYKNELVASAVHFFKYRFVQDLHAPLGKILAKSLLYSELPLPDFILPVPLHQRRLRWRGFNQSALLAQYVSENLTPGFPIPVLDNFLIRQKYTRPQMEIKKYSARQKNIQNAFIINPEISCHSGLDPESNQKNEGNSLDFCLRRNDNTINLQNKTILLIDDICTTGSTLFECAKVLKVAGAGVVFAAVLARQETGK